MTGVLIADTHGDPNGDVVTPPTEAGPTPRGRGPREFLCDWEILVVRNLRATVRVPQMMLAIAVQPLMFVLLFSYVFGEALGGDSYRQFLIAGIMVQTVAFNAAFSALGLAGDLEDGVMDRFRTLPMSSVSIVAARSSADIAVNVVGLAVMSVAGLVIGWRITPAAEGLAAVGEVAAGYGVLLLFGVAMSWVGAIVGIVSVSAQAAQSLCVTLLFPLTFVSSAFVPSALLPAPLQTVADWNPVTSVARAARESFGNPTAVNPLLPEPATWASAHPHAYASIFSLVLLVVCVPLSVWALQRRVR